MARRRTTVVTEDLSGLEESYRDKPEYIRIRALALLKENPDISHRQVAETLGVSKPSVDRWWGAYLRSGVQGVLEIGNKPVDRTRRRASRQGQPEAFPDVRNMIALMNRMPLTLDVAEAIEVLRTELMSILPDVDRIVIGVDAACDLISPARYEPDLYVVQDATARARSRRKLSVEKSDAETTKTAILLEHFRAQGYPVDDYHPPAFFEILYGGSAPLGTIFLWRECSKKPISKRSIDLLASLLPFLTYALSNIIARQHYASPGDRLFREALKQLSKEGGLSVQERRVINYRFHGYSYKVIAAEMGVSEDTVKKHLTSVHRKTGTSGHAELFAKYFAPLIVPSGESLKG